MEVNLGEITIGEDMINAGNVNIPLIKGDKGDKGDKRRQTEIKATQVAQEQLVQVTL